MAEQELNKFEQSDVRLWGLVAISTATFMFLSSSIGLLLPTGWNNFMKETRQDFGTVAQLQSELRSIRLEFASIKRETNVADTRINLGQENNSYVSKRVRALESSIPLLLEALPNGTRLDKNLITASINEANGEEIIRLDDNAKVVRSYLFENSPMAENTPPEFQQALPEVISDAEEPKVGDEELKTASAAPQAMPNNNAQSNLPSANIDFGVILGPKIDKSQANLNWLNIKSNVGTLLLGLEPRMIPVVNEVDKIQLVVGPLLELGEATRLCQEIIRQGYVCEAGEFDGFPLDG